MKKFKMTSSKNSKSNKWGMAHAAMHVRHNRDFGSAKQNTKFNLLKRNKTQYF